MSRSGLSQRQWSQAYDTGETMGDGKTSTEALASSLSLSGDPEDLRRYYGTWAASYDEDVAEEGWVAPAEMAKMLTSLSSGGPGTGPETAALPEIIDAGCGTGLLGVRLKEAGFRLIDGFDLSGEMVALAATRSAYRELRSGVEMGEAPLVFGSGRYDIGVACGVFTHGHVAPAGLRSLISLVKVSGLVLVNTRPSYSEATGFEDEVRGLEASGRIDILACRRNRPYIREETAHYWAFLVRAVWPRDSVCGLCRVHVKCVSASSRGEGSEPLATPSHPSDLAMFTCGGRPLRPLAQQHIRLTDTPLGLTPRDERHKAHDDASRCHCFAPHSHVPNQGQSSWEPQFRPPRFPDPGFRPAMHTERRSVTDHHQS